MIQQYTGDYVHQFNSTTVNDLSGHYTRFNYDAVEPQDKVSIRQPGLQHQSAGRSGGERSHDHVGGNDAGFTLGFSTNGPQPRIDQVAQLDDDLSKVIGRHTFKFGYDGRRFNVHNPFYAVNSGSFSFGKHRRLFLRRRRRGLPAGRSHDLQPGQRRIHHCRGIPELRVRAGYLEAYTDKLTLSYGLGYSIDTPLHNLQYGGSGIACIVTGEQSTVFPGAPTGLVYGGDAGCTNCRPGEDPLW